MTPTCTENFSHVQQINIETQIIHANAIVLTEITVLRSISLSLTLGLIINYKYIVIASLIFMFYFVRNKVLLLRSQ